MNGEPGTRCLQEQTICGALRSDRWAVACGPGSVDCDHRVLVGGYWSVGAGRWSLVGGYWSVGMGRCVMVSSERPAKYNSASKTVYAFEEVEGRFVSASWPRWRFADRHVQGAAGDGSAVGRAE